MMTPGGFGEANMGPEVIHDQAGSFVVDENSGGLVVPESYAAQKKAAQVSAEQAAAQTGDAPVEPTAEGVTPGDEQILKPGDGEESVEGDGSEKQDVAALTTEKRAETIAKAVKELEENGMTEATSEEDLINQIAEKTAQTGGNVEKETARAKRWLDRAAAIAGMTFNEFKAAHEGSNFKTFLDAFFVFGTEGRFGDTSPSSLKESLGEGTDDAYLNEVLEKGGSKTLLEFFQTVLEDSNIQSLDEVKKLVNRFNTKAEMSWDALHGNMADFLNEAKGNYKERSFSKIKFLFSRLEDMSNEDILKYFNISLEEEKGEVSTQGAEAANQSSTTAGNAEAAPTANLQETPQAA